jgi:protein O-GlcNAc transferase
MNIDKALQSAFQHFRSGDLKQAEHLYKIILKTYPDNVQALYFLGLIYDQLENHEFALKYFQSVIQIDPKNAGTYINIGNTFFREGLHKEAIKSYQKAIQINAELVDAYINLGKVFLSDHQHDEAIQCCQKALTFVPDQAELYSILGSAYQGKGQLNESLTYFRKALQQNSSYPDIYNNMGIVLHHMGQFNEAIKCYQEALKLNPNLNVAHINLGNTLKEIGRFHEAIVSYQKALQLNPSSHDALNNLGNVFKDMGLPDEAETYYRHAIQLYPNEVAAFQNLLMIMHYNPRYDAQAIFHEHVQSAKQFMKPFATVIFPHKNSKIPSRRLKLGYVSPDFRKQSVGFFIEPILEAHDRNNFEIFCYANLPFQDKMTERMKRYADRWREIYGMFDERAAELIRNDGIDILVDLAGHTAFNRILIFAHKPSPVQVAWIGYPDTTGIASVDYKIVDNFTDPPGMTDQFYTEKLARLPGCFLCYQPYGDSPEVAALPALANGYITFGSCNNFAKISPQLLTMWAAILHAVPNSQLILKAKSLSDTETRQNTTRFFTEAGIGEERIQLLHWLPSTKAHLEIYNRIDIGLDTFPYNGTTTTCEALWMGVPVITLAGNTHASRVGASLLSNVGLRELVSHTSEEYVKMAAALAKDTQRLLHLRNNLRKMMSRSPLMNKRQFIFNLENCYRWMWETWCRTT